MPSALFRNSEYYTIDLSLDLQEQYAHLLIAPLHYGSFIPALDLSVSALLDFRLAS